MTSILTKINASEDILLRNKWLNFELKQFALFNVSFAKAVLLNGSSLITYPNFRSCKSDPKTNCTRAAVTAGNINVSGTNLQKQKKS